MTEVVAAPVAYRYVAALYCPPCACDAVFVAKLFERPSETEDPEDYLNRCATSVGVDRDDERSFDTWTFPKPVFESELEGDDDEHECDRCRKGLP